jgi:hypothetical protein
MTAKIKSWHVLIIREWKTTPPMAMTLAETFATKAKAEAVAKVMRAEGPYHSRCLRETYYVVQSPDDIEWLTCNASGASNLYIKRPAPPALERRLATFERERFERERRPSAGSSLRELRALILPPILGQSIRD